MNSGGGVFGVMFPNEPVRREQPATPCGAITWVGHVPRWIGRDRRPVGSSAFERQNRAGENRGRPF